MTSTSGKTNGADPASTVAAPRRRRTNRTFPASSFEDALVIVMNAASGRITRTTKITDQPVLIEYAGDDAVGDPAGEESIKVLAAEVIVAFVIYNDISKLVPNG